MFLKVYQISEVDDIESENVATIVVLLNVFNIIKLLN